MMTFALLVVLATLPRLAGSIAPVEHGPDTWLAMLAKAGPDRLPQRIEDTTGASLASVSPKHVSSALPNIVFILSDDLGYGDYSISPGVDRSGGQIPTPNIQRMADAGLKFARGYSGPVCAPSRCTLMTGRHMGRCTIRGNDGSYTPLVDSDVTVAEVLRATHVTAIVGKWGLGDFGTSGYPSSQGFDHFIGQDSQLACHDWFPEYVNNNSLQFQPLNDRQFLGPGCIEDPDGGRCTWANDLVRDESVNFIRRNANGEKPFFLYVSSTTPHDAILANHPDDNYPVPFQYLAAEFIDPTWPSVLQKFAAAVWAQDLIVGAVLDELAAQGIEENTIVFFAGDNGPDMHDFSIFQDMGPFRGKKRSLHEGGTRQTIAVQWKGRIAPGTETDQLFAFWDLLPTVAELAGLPRSEWPMTDGVSLAPTLTGEGAQESHEYLYWEFCFYEPADGLMPQSYPPGWIQALRVDENGAEWKGIRVDRGPMMLWNLTADPSESVDLAGSWPELVLKMARMMEEAHVENQHWPSVGEDGAGPRCCDACYNPQGDNCEVQCIPTQPRMSFWKSDAAKSMKKSEERTVEASALAGVWSAPNGFTYTIEVTGSFIKVWNMDDPLACWQFGDGVFDIDANRLSATVRSSEAFEESHHHSCMHHLIARVTTTSETAHLDQDYAYQNVTYHIQWQTREGNTWPVWSRNTGLQTRAAKPPHRPIKPIQMLADVPAEVITVADVFAGKSESEILERASVVEEFAGNEKAIPVEKIAVPDHTPVPTQRVARNHTKSLRAQPSGQAKLTVEDIFAGRTDDEKHKVSAQDPRQSDAKGAAATGNNRENNVTDVKDVLAVWKSEAEHKVRDREEGESEAQGKGQPALKYDLRGGQSNGEHDEDGARSKAPTIKKEPVIGRLQGGAMPSRLRRIVENTLVGLSKGKKSEVNAQEQPQPSMEENVDDRERQAADKAKQTVDDVFAGLVVTQKEEDVHKIDRGIAATGGVGDGASGEHVHRSRMRHGGAQPVSQLARAPNTGAPMKFQDMIQLALAKK